MTYLGKLNTEDSSEFEWIRKYLFERNQSDQDQICEEEDKCLGRSPFFNKKTPQSATAPSTKKNFIKNEQDRFSKSDNRKGGVEFLQK